MSGLPHQGAVGQVVLFHAGAIGDLLLSRGVLLALRQTLPQATWEAIGYPERLLLLQDELRLARAASFDAAWVPRYLRDPAACLDAPAALRQPGTLIVSFVDGIPPAGVPNPVVRLRVTPGPAALSPPRSSIERASRLPAESSRGNEPRPPQQREAPQHVSSLLRQQLAACGVVPNLAAASAAGAGPATPPPLRFSTGARQAASAWLRQRGIPGLAAGAIPDRPIVALHPGSGSVQKCWPVERFALLAGWLRRQCGARLIVCLGPAETERLEPRQWNLAEADILPAVAPPLDVLGALLRRCHLFIGNDSGIAHLAAAAGCPSVVLFGVTDWRIWRPLGSHVHCIAAEGEAPTTDWRGVDPAAARVIMERIPIDRVCELVAGLDRQLLAELWRERLLEDRL
ncbi:MAG: glycosyltransferase family 9 protein [Candidatus Tectomicrobia bacterium]|nr:glycosyltransferase family 9 protein [Candidatus Tectomicrobia bacterium]